MSHCHSHTSCNIVNQKPRVAMRSNFVVTDGTGSWRQWRKIWHHNDSQFSVQVTWTCRVSFESDIWSIERVHYITSEIYLQAPQSPRLVPSAHYSSESWWRHQMEIFSASLTLCDGKPPFTGRFPSQRPVTRSFDVFFDLPAQTVE